MAMPDYGYHVVDYLNSNELYRLDYCNMLLAQLWDTINIAFIRTSYGPHTYAIEVGDENQMGGEVRGGLVKFGNTPTECMKRLSKWAQDEILKLRKSQQSTPTIKSAPPTPLYKKFGYNTGSPFM